VIRDLLTLTTVQVARDVYTTDGMGGRTTSTTLTTLSRAAIWQAGSGDRFLSDKVAKASTHVLAFEPSAYAWAAGDLRVVYGGGTYRVTGHADDVFQTGELMVVGLERIS
jgi:hypothetical protein